jgi:hypothetical protein
MWQSETATIPIPEQALECMMFDLWNPNQQK